MNEKIKDEVLKEVTIRLMQRTLSYRKELTEFEKKIVMDAIDLTIQKCEEEFEKQKFCYEQQLIEVVKSKESGTKFVEDILKHERQKTASEIFRELEKKFITYDDYKKIKKKFGCLRPMGCE